MSRGDDGEAVLLGVSGARGRMGRAVVQTAGDRSDVRATVGIDTVADSTGRPPVVTPDALGAAIDEYDPTVLIDFSTPEATGSLAATCAERGVGLVVGTTGFEDDDIATLREYADRTPILKASNFSRGIQALLAALEPALSALPAYDIELSETHHNGKRDAPSGTAATILAAIQEERALEPVYGRSGMQPRADDEIGVQVSRLGDVRGEHVVRVGGNDEVLTLAHRVEDRDVFAAGALDAAVWLADRNPGWYDFGEVIQEA